MAKPVRIKSARLGISVPERMKDCLEVIADMEETNLNDTVVKILQAEIDKRQDVLEPLLKAREIYMQTVKSYAK